MSGASRRLRGMTWRTKLLVCLPGVGALPAVLVCVINYGVTSHLLLPQRMENTSCLLEQDVAAVNSVLSTCERLSDNLAMDGDLRALLAGVRPDAVVRGRHAGIRARADRGGRRTGARRRGGRDMNERLLDPRPRPDGEVRALARELGAPVPDADCAGLLELFAREPERFAQLARGQEDWQAKALRFFPGRRRFLCHSWLLEPKLRLLLAEGSNILRFQSGYRILELFPGERQAEERIFGFVSDDPELYGEETSLRRAAKRFLRTGALGTALGELRDPPG